MTNKRRSSNDNNKNNFFLCIEELEMNRYVRSLIFLGFSKYNACNAGSHLFGRTFLPIEIQPIWDFWLILKKWIITNTKYDNPVLLKKKQKNLTKILNINIRWANTVLEMELKSKK